MKRISIALLAAICCYVVISCHKPDLPGNKRCQIRSIEDTVGPSARLTNYFYNQKRWLDSIAVTATLGAGTPVNVKILYNNKGLPITIRTHSPSTSTHRLVYTNGRVTAIETLGSGGVYQPAYTFLYDSLGRIIERTSASGFSALRYQYSDGSRNFTRRQQWEVTRPGPFPMLELFRESTFTYDNKVHPWTTWPNMALVPFHFDIVNGGGIQFEPIPENNWTYQRASAAFRVSMLLAYEYFYTYQYDDVFPLRYDLKLVKYNPFLGGVESTTFSGTRFSYDCHGGNLNY